MSHNGTRLVDHRYFFENSCFATPAIYVMLIVAIVGAQWSRKAACTRQYAANNIQSCQAEAGCCGTTCDGMKVLSLVGGVRNRESDSRLTDHSDYYRY